MEELVRNGLWYPKDVSLKPGIATYSDVTDLLSKEDNRPLHRMVVIK